MGYDDFRRDLGRTLADPERMAGFHYDRIGPLEDAIGELSGWYAFSAVAKQDQARRTTSPGLARLAYADTPQSFVDPFKGVGGMIPAHAAVARSSRSAACIEDLSRTSYRVKLYENSPTGRHGQ